MFQRARSNSITPLDSQRHFAKDSNAAAEEQLNKRLEGEIDQLLASFGDIIQSSRIYGSGSARTSARLRQPRSTYANDDSDSSDFSEGEAGSPEPPKDKYIASQEAYSAQTRAATMVRSVENLMSMVADIKRAYLVNDSSALVEMAGRRRQLMEERIGKTRREIEALNATLDTAVRELEAVYYNSMYVE
ncbi:hypothetical protein LPJ78_002328 [Coemansia sp. RSA 989]|nr:hypothetical protein LPJ68_001644 [Coemansia sp. RSA 1086]KAJ1751375.1 hypothetical protein LPJ79_002156 [Coemansia sp. RSA 1821]KAJ1865833.1 hypothetical protein LPJ78_002328 [Coemansia sp. RSA 989]KAJ1873085.1 hypothetical protein LPJ55_002551 [Coemansia sp. RSA 990]KAJ2647776.1 hypothetical protein IWW40_004398 [Coemansia sp. RSA 1250]KAJ2669860.1 hypothetical protein IWW42_004314 [Coemansia sp. RSA 1085]